MGEITRSGLAHHNVSEFDSGNDAFNVWLKSKSLINEQKGESRTEVVCDDDRVIGFYSLATSAVEQTRVSRRIGRNTPDPVPMILLGQLATDVAAS